MGNYGYYYDVMLSDLIKKYGSRDKIPEGDLKRIDSAAEKASAADTDISMDSRRRAFKSTPKPKPVKQPTSVGDVIYTPKAVKWNYGYHYGPSEKAFHGRAGTEFSMTPEGAKELSRGLGGKQAGKENYKLHTIDLAKKNIFDATDPKKARILKRELLKIENAVLNASPEAESINKAIHADVVSRNLKEIGVEISKEDIVGIIKTTIKRESEESNKRLIESASTRVMRQAGYHGHKMNDRGYLYEDKTEKLIEPPETPIDNASGPLITDEEILRQQKKQRLQQFRRREDNNVQAMSLPPEAMPSPIHDYPLGTPRPQFYPYPLQEKNPEDYMHIQRYQPTNPLDNILDYGVLGELDRIKGIERDIRKWPLPPKLPPGSIPGAMI